MKHTRVTVASFTAVLSPLAVLFASLAGAQARRGHGRSAIIVGLCAVLAQAGLGAAQALAQCIEEQRLTPSTSVEVDRFFGWVAAVDGDTVVAGGGGVFDTIGLNAGSTYVFVRSAGLWTKQAKLIGSDIGNVRGFGVSVAIDGDTAVVGADFGGDAVEASGAAYVFVRSAGEWTEQTKLTASDATGGAQFGFSVAVDGDTIVVGAYMSGAAYVFVRSGGVWTEQAKLTASDAASGADLGFSVAVDGDTAVVGAPGDTFNPSSRSGAIHVFVRSAGVWTEQARLIGSGVDRVGRFGLSVDVDGDTAVATGHGDSPYVFVRLGGIWVQQARLAANAFDIAVDGDTVVVGYSTDQVILEWEDGWPIRHATGSLTVFARSAGHWTKQIKLRGSDPDESRIFGVSVAIDGDTVVSGTTGDATNLRDGPVFVFSCSPGEADDPGGQPVPGDGDTDDPGGQPVPGDGEPDDPGGQPSPGDGGDDGMVDQQPCGLLSFLSLTFMWFGLLGLRWSHRLRRG